MNWLTLAAIYFTVWWLVLFAVLPFGVRADENPEPGNAPGAPVAPMLGKKFLWTTIISAVLVGAIWGLFATGLLEWRAIVRPST